jgi:LPXTG-motif cell wall-anchored protein
MGTLARCLTVAGIAMLVIATPAGAQEDYPPEVERFVVVSQSTVRPGETITVSGRCPPNTPLRILFDGAQVGTSATDPQGNFSTQVTIPSDAAPGSHTIRAVGPGCDVSTAVTVLAAAAVPRRGPIALTGSQNTLPALWIGLAALALGTAIVVGARRRATVRAH